MNYEIFSLKTTKEWEKVFKELPPKQQDVYYTPEYYRLYEIVKHGKAFCFVYKQNGETVMYPFLHNSVNKLGYSLDREYYDIQGAYGYNGLVTSSPKKELINGFYKAFNAFCLENNIIAEFVRFHPLLQNQRFSIPFLDVIYNRQTVYINLNHKTEDIWNNFQRTTKKQINRGYKRHNITIKILRKNSLETDEFIDIYWNSMNRVASEDLLYFDRSYFQQLFQLDNLVQFVAYYEEKLISTIVCLRGANILHGHLGGTYSEYLKLSPFSVLYWEMIKYAKKHRLDYVHVGGGNSSSEDDSLLNYKKHFSNSTSSFYIGKKIYNKNIYSKVLQQWEKKYPKSYNMNKDKLLGYREII